MVPKRNINTTVLGLDPGVGRMGFAVLKGPAHKPRIVDVGCTETSAKLPHAERLVAISDSVRALIKQHHPAAVAVERLFFSKNVKTAMAVGEARGVMLAEIARAKVTLIELSPQQVKAAATGEGNADKQQIAKMLCLIFKLKAAPTPDDAADALAVALSGLTQRRP